MLVTFLLVETKYLTPKVKEELILLTFSRVPSLLSAEGRRGIRRLVQVKVGRAGSSNCEAASSKCVLQASFCPLQLYQDAHP